MTSQSNQVPEIDTNKIERIIADHNKAMREDMASEIVGGSRSKAITDVITVKAILSLLSHSNKRAEIEAAIKSKKSVIKDCKLHYSTFGNSEHYINCNALTQKLNDEISELNQLKEKGQ